MNTVETPTIYTVGHSTHPTETFIRLLQTHGIEAIVDVRSRPYSSYNPQFNKPTLRDSLWKANVSYSHVWELGGYPDDKKYYDEGGRAVYERIAAEKSFKEGIKRLDAMVDDMLVAVMCAQGKPQDCHRHPLLARCLSERGLTVQHILRDGSLQNASEMFDAEVDAQLPLIELSGEDPYWRSPHSAE